MLIVPQAIGLATLAGLPPEQGIYAAAFAPLITAFTSSSTALQSGPTALTSLLTLGALNAAAHPVVGQDRLTGARRRNRDQHDEA